MNPFSRLYNRLKYHWNRRLAGENIASFVSQIIHEGDDPAAIYDGISYALPVLLPDSLRQRLEQTGNLEQFIQESYDKATDFQFDSPYKIDLPFQPITVNPLEEWNISTRRYILEQTHAAFHRNPDAKRGTNLVAQFSIGNGFHLLTFHPDIEELLKEFIENPQNRIREYERQAANDLLVDGELILQWFHSSSTGETIIMPKRPWELEYIKTELGNYRNVIEYQFQLIKDQYDALGGTFDTEFINIPEDEILFVAINNNAYELRGRPELYPILPWLKARKDWLENRARINYWLSMVLWNIKVDTNNPNTLANVKANWSQPPKPGSVAVQSSKIEVEPIQASPQASESADDGRQLLIQVAKGFGLPEYMLGDGQNANLASATRQQLPALVRFEDYQRTLLLELWTPMFKKVIQFAVDDGRLPIMVQKHDGIGNPIPDELIPTVEAFEVSYGNVMESNLLDLTTALEKQVANDFTSTRQARIILDNDPDQVEKQINDERETEMIDIAQGRVPRPPEVRNDALDADDIEDDEPERIGEPS